MVELSRRALTVGAASAAFAFATDATAEEIVKIGAIYPLSGNSASAGNYEKMAIELGADLVELADGPLDLLGRPSHARGRQHHRHGRAERHHAEQDHDQVERAHEAPVWSRSSSGAGISPRRCRHRATSRASAPLSPGR